MRNDNSFPTRHECLLLFTQLEQLPYLLGRNEDISKMTNMSDIITVMEQMRETTPGADLLRLSSPKGIMRVFSLTSAPTWQTEDGTLNKETISDFLTQTKQMYDIQMNGLSEEALLEWESDFVNPKSVVLSLYFDFRATLFPFCISYSFKNH